MLHDHGGRDHGREGLRYLPDTGRNQPVACRIAPPSETSADLHRRTIEPPAMSLPIWCCPKKNIKPFQTYALPLVISYFIALRLTIQIDVYSSDLISRTMMARTIMGLEFPTARKTGRVVAHGDNAGTRTSPATAIFSMGLL